MNDRQDLSGKRVFVIGIRGLADLSTAKELLESIRPDFIFHLAGHVVGQRSADAVLPTFECNLMSKVNLLTAAREVGCSRFILAGSHVPMISALTDATINPLGKMEPNKYFALSFLVLFGLLNWIYFSRGFSGHLPWWQAHQELSSDRLNQKLLIALSGCAVLMMLTMGWVRETARAYNGYLIYGAMTFEEEGMLYQPPAGNRDGSHGN